MERIPKVHGQHHRNHSCQKTQKHTSLSGSYSRDETVTVRTGGNTLSLGYSLTSTSNVLVDQSNFIVNIF